MFVEKLLAQWLLGPLLNKQTKILSKLHRIIWNFWEWHFCSFFKLLVDITPWNSILQHLYNISNFLVSQMMPVHRQITNSIMRQREAIHCLIWPCHRQANFSSLIFVSDWQRKKSVEIVTVYFFMCSKINQKKMLLCDVFRKKKHIITYEKKKLVYIFIKTK